MSDDELFEQLGKTARESFDQTPLSTDDPIWEALAEGGLSQDEIETLRAEAEKTPEGRQAFQAFLPLGPEFHDRAVERINEKAKEGSEVARVLPMRPRRTWQWPALGAAIAASLLLLLWPGAERTPMPGYEVQLAGGQQLLRSEAPPEGERTFTTDSQFEVLLRPATGVEGDLEGAVYVLDGAEPRQVEGVRVEISEQGAVRFRGAIRSLLEARGEPVGSAAEVTLWLSVARDGHATAARTALASEAVERQDADWLLVATTLRLEEDPEEA